MNIEIKPIPNHPHYFAGEDGLIYSDKSGKLRALKRSGEAKHGYYRVTVSIEAVHSYPFVHRLVAMAWHPRPRGKYRVIHIDNDRFNNAPDNLRWGDAAEFIAHRASYGLFRKSKLMANDVIRIRELAADGKRYKDIAMEYDINTEYVSTIAKGGAWKLVGGPRTRKYSGRISVPNN